MAIEKFQLIVSLGWQAAFPNRNTKIFNRLGGHRPQHQIILITAVLCHRRQLKDRIYRFHMLHTLDHTNQLIVQPLDILVISIIRIGLIHRNLRQAPIRLVLFHQRTAEPKSEGYHDHDRCNTDNNAKHRQNRPDLSLPEVTAAHTQ